MNQGSVPLFKPGDRVRVRKANPLGHIRTPFFVRAQVESYVLTIFPDGRAIIGGVDDPALARSIYAKYVGS